MSALLTILSPQALLDLSPSSPRHPCGCSLCASHYHVHPDSMLMKTSCYFNPQKEYAAEISDRLSSLGLYADVDNGENTLPKKIRNGEIAQYNFILGTCFNHIKHASFIESDILNY